MTDQTSGAKGRPEGAGAGGQGEPATDAEFLLALTTGLKPETIRLAGLRRLSAAEIQARFRVQVDCGGILIPYGADGYGRVRLDTPFKAPGWDRPARYLSPPGTPPRLYVPPNLPPGALEQGPLVITEGEKKALRACEEGIPCVATAGVWSWKVRGPDGEKLPDLDGLLPDFDRFKLSGRPIYLVYDSDIGPHHPAFGAYVRLAAVLEARGAGPIRILTLPPVLGDGKTGFDDYLAGRSAGDFWELAEKAPVYEPAFELTLLPSGAGLKAIRRALESIRSRAGQLDSLGREVLREAVIRELKRLGVSSPAKLANAALGPADSTGADGPESGPVLVLADPEPWPEPVDGAALAEAVRQTIARYVVLPGQAEEAALTLWVLATWVFEARDVAPRLAITSPTKRCGKTLLLAVLTGLVRRPLTAANVTPAAVFRALEAFRPTLLVDETDTFLGNRDELVGVLNAGWFRPTAVVVRCEGEDAEPRVFNVFGPVALAAIGELPDTLNDRCLRIKMRRRGGGEETEPFAQERFFRETADLRRKLARWARDNFSKVRAADPAVPEGLNDRAADNWRVLVAVAEALGGDWPELGRQAARTLELGADPDDDDIAVRLLADIREVFGQKRADFLSSSELTAALLGLADRPWCELGPRGLTAHRLARMLRRFGIRPIKTEGSNGYRLDSFAEAFGRYLPPVKVPEVPEPPAGGPSSAEAAGTSGGSGGLSRNVIEGGTDDDWLVL